VGDGLLTIRADRQRQTVGAVENADKSIFIAELHWGLISCVSMYLIQSSYQRPDAPLMDPQKRNYYRAGPAWALAKRALKRFFGAQKAGSPLLLQIALVLITCFC